MAEKEIITPFRSRFPTDRKNLLAEFRYELVQSFFTLRYVYLQEKPSTDRNLRMISSVACIHDGAEGKRPIDQQEKRRVHIHMFRFYVANPI